LSSIGINFNPVAAGSCSFKRLDATPSPTQGSRAENSGGKARHFFSCSASSTGNGKKPNLAFPCRLIWPPPRIFGVEKRTGQADQDPQISADTAASVRGNWEKHSDSIGGTH